MPLRIFKETTVRLPRKRLSELFELIRRGEGRHLRSVDVNLVFTTDRRMKTLNKQFRDKNKTTDVLSFSIDDGSTDNTFLGEIYVSVPVAKRQAKSYGASLSEEHLRLACHGLLHLMGYDHLNPADETIMKEREEHYLSRIAG